MSVKKEKFIPYGHQWIGQDDIEAVVKVLRGDWLTQGPQVAEFERAIARYCGAKYAVAVSSGTAALHAAYEAAGISQGDEVITTPLTFAATANAIYFCGAKPVFADIDPNTLNINPKEVEKKITKRTKAIAAVDFAGLPCDYNSLRDITKKHGLLLIEDACHGLGAEYKGKKIGSVSDLTVFSFHPVKVITAGEGGAVVTDNKEFADMMRIFRQHGIIKKPAKGGWYYEIAKPGYNYRITTFQCALGQAQLKKLNRFLKRRQEIARIYSKAFAGLEEIIIPKEPTGCLSAWHLYPVQFRLEKLKATRRNLFDWFRTQGIGVQVHYMPVHLHPFYKKQFGYKAGDYPMSEKYYQRALTLPLFPAMTNSDVQRVIKVTKKLTLKGAKLLP